MIAETLSQYPVFVQRTVLPNGLTIITANTSSALCQVDLCFNAGGRRDGQRPGLAHFTEHVLARGQAPDGSNPRYKDLRKRGATFGASTSYDITRYRGDALTEDFQSLVSAILENVLVDDVCIDHVEEERITIMQEVRDRLPGDHFVLWSYREWYPSRPEVHNPLGGYLDDVEEISVNDICDFVDKYYNLANAVVIATGGVEHEELVHFVSSMDLSKVSRGVRNDYEVCEFALHRVDYAGDQRSPGVTLRFLGPELNTDEYLLFMVCMNILTSGIDSMLMQRLRQKEELAYAVIPGRDISFNQEYNIQCWTQPKHFEKVESAMFEEIHCLTQGEVSSDLFETIRMTMIRKSIEDNEEIESTVSFSAWSNILMNSWSRNDFSIRTDRVAFYRRMCIEDVIAVAAKFLSPEKIGVTHSTYAPVDR